MSLYIQVPIQQIADGLTAIGWSSAGGGGDATLSYSATAPSTPTNGTLSGLGGLVWMSIGGFIMAKMVNFEI